MPRLKTLGLLALLLPLIVSYDPSQPVPNPVSELSSAIDNASANIATNLRVGRHLGFDTYAYPGDDAMLAWRQNDAPYEWVGYYLPSTPCHRGESWSGKRERLASMGWGTAVIYVGQQVWSGTPRQKIVRTKYVTKYIQKRVKVSRLVKGKIVRGKRRKARRVSSFVQKRIPIKVPVKTVTYARAEPGQSCSTHLVSGARGTKDANDAIAKAAGEGFVRGTVIFLDIERMEKVPSAMRDYYKAWTARVLDDGTYRPGYYAHNHNAKIIYNDVSGVFLDAGSLEQPPFWIASGRGFSENKQPHEVGHDFAKVWQGVLDVVQTHNGFKLPIDVNVAAVKSPSSSGLPASN
ncbi:MAG: glycoside hydrolase domain-containing protein [Gemmatimonadaceae bacterium]